jgi:hypothetical protein
MMVSLIALKSNNHKNNQTHEKMQLYAPMSQQFKLKPPPLLLSILLISLTMLITAPK